MATLRDIYQGLHPEGNASADFTFGGGGQSFIINGRCHFSFDTNTRYVSYFISNASDWLPQVRALINDPQLACTKADQTVEFLMGHPERGIPMQKASDLPFVGRMYLYAEVALEDDQRAELLAAGRERGLSIELRDLRWLEAYNVASKPLAFLSHDSRDKEAVARPLVTELGRLLCSVWYDEYSLRVGDSLTGSIDRGIREVNKCILIISPNFVTNNGWSKAEFKAIMNKHISEGMIILPVWHMVTRDDVYAYSSFLIDVFATTTSKGLPAVAGDLAAVLRPPAKRV